MPAMDEASGTGGDQGSRADPAATVVVARDGDHGLEVLLLRRNARPPFAGMWVFPGGRVEPGDADPRRPGDDLAAARRATVRETEEEAGILLDIDGLVPYAHWTPPGTTPRRFTTWFFLAPAPATLVVVDGHEIHEGAWLRPGDALRRRDRREIELAPPTWVTLWQLSALPDVAAAVALAAARRPERFATASPTSTAPRSPCGGATPATSTVTAPARVRGTGCGCSTPAGTTSAAAPGRAPGPEQVPPATGPGATPRAGRSGPAPPGWSRRPEAGRLRGLRCCYRRRP